MKNNVLVCGLIVGMLASGSAFANPAVYGASQLQFNTQIMDIMNSQEPENPVQERNVQTTIKKQQKTFEQALPDIYVPPTITPSGAKNLSDKDLQIEGRIERTQKESLYQNQTPEELQTMVTQIGRKIVKVNSLKNTIQFKYDEQDVANANTNINNTIRVYKGLIKYCTDEAELAYVIGHEIGHAASHHVVKGIGVNIAGAAATTAAAYGIEQVTDNKWAELGVVAASELLTDLGSKKVSRVMEKDADLLSIDYIVKAGYNPLAAISIMYKIGENYVDFWADHPSTDKRIITMYEYIKEKYPEKLEEGYESVAFDEAMEAYIYTDTYNKK